MEPKRILITDLTVKEWGWVSYEEFMEIEEGVI